MKRLMRLGLAACAVLAFTAGLGVASASASRIVTESSTVTATPTTHTYTSGRGDLTCTGTGFTGSIPQGAWPYLESPAPLQEAGGGTCVSFSTSKAMQYNGCYMVLRPGSETAKGVFGGTAEIGPAGCGPFKWERSAGCFENFYPGSSYPATFQNVGTGTGAKVHVSVDGSIENLYSCAGSKTSQTFHWGWDLSSSTGVQVSAQTGLFIEGAAPTQPKLAAEEYPASYSGPITKNLVIKTESGNIECSGTVSGSSLSKAEATIYPLLNLNNCYAFGFKATVQIGSLCWESLTLANAGPPYSGTMNLECPGGGATALSFSPQSFGVTLCTITFPKQTLGTATLENVGAGLTRHVVASVSGSGLKHYGTGSYCGTTETANGTLSTTFELSGRH